MNFIELAKLRYSVRSYKNAPIEEAKMNYIMECVRMAPSAVNFQPWEFRIVNDAAGLEALKRAYPREWIQTAPCIIVACADHEQSWHRKSDGKDHADIDLAIAIEHLCLAAAEQELGTCWVCNFDVACCRDALHLADTLEPVALIPIGYPAETVVAEKKRKSLSEILF